VEELVFQMNVALSQGDWSSVVMLGGRLYGMACTCGGDRRFADGIRDVIAGALLLVEYPTFERVCMPLVAVMREQLNSGY